MSKLVKDNSFLNNLHLGLITFDTNGKVVNAIENQENSLNYIGSVIVGEEIKFRKSTNGDSPQQLIETVLNEQKNAYFTGSFNHLNSEDTHWILLSCHPIFDEEKKLAGGILVLNDATKLHNNNESLSPHYNTKHLPSQDFLLERLKQVISASARFRKLGALLFINININILDWTHKTDAKKVEKNNEFILEVFKRIKHTIRNSDTVVKINQNEFVVLLESLSDNEEIAAIDVQNVSEKIIQNLELSFQEIAEYENENFHMEHNVYIGATIFNGSETIDNILNQAKIAVKQAGQNERSSMAFFNKDTQDKIKKRRETIQELKYGIEHDEMVLYFQKQVDKDGKTVGAEALVRWKHPTKGMIPPLNFIPLAEETGLIIELGHWVLEKSCQQLNDWSKTSFGKELVLAVNTSSRQLQKPNFVENLETLISKYQINPKLLKLEITESLLLEKTEEMLNTIAKICKLGVFLSLDDFGTGYSSLQYLKILPISQIKIDRSFVKDILNETNDEAIVKAIIDISKSMKMDVVAEGVETKEQYELLLKKECFFFQGYLFGKPLPIEEFNRELYEKT